jgi:SAM-dependent methyltransferase
MRKGGATEGWEREAANWVAWARAPRQDPYWAMGPIFLREIVPTPGQSTLEIGCGEGRVSRDLAARGHQVVGIDASQTLVRAAREADPVGRYLVADAARLPFADRSFSVVVACNSLMDIDDMADAVAEAARVLTRDGRFCVSVIHPTAQVGRFDESGRFIIDGSYFGRRRTSQRRERNGLTMTFEGWANSLEGYFRVLEAAGLVVERLREPPWPEDELSPWRRVPNFLFLRARLA